MAPVQRCSGAQSLRYRLVLAHVSGRTLRVDDVRVDDPSPGLRDYEASLLRLLEKVTNGTVVEINETGTVVRYLPGQLVGGAGLEHDCAPSRGIAYYMEPLVCLALFAKKPLSITLRGVTHHPDDCSVDTWRAASVPLLRRAVGEAAAAGLDVTLLRRGLAPAGGGEVLLRVPSLKGGLPVPLRWTQPGLVKRIRGVAFTERVSPQAANRMVDAARGVLNPLLPDVYIFTDHRSGKAAGGSPGYGLSLVAETTTGCALAADAVARHHGDGGGDGGGEPDTPDEVGARVAHALLAEIAAAGAVDGSHQALALFLCAVGPDALSTVTLGRLAPAAVRLLRDLRDFLGVTFNLEPGGTGTVTAACVGLGVGNVARAVT